MDGDGPGRAEAHFHRLAALDGAARARALAQIAAEDAALAEEVAALLAAHDAEGPMDRLGATLGLQSFASALAGTGMTGRTIGQYEIGELAGRGGMGDVYRARDTLLDRDVALKFLPPWLGRDDMAGQRFLAEARTIAALDHPNVCTLFEVATTDDGALFMVMPFYDGETLRSRLARGPLSTTEALQTALQVARGLAAAHERGIVHRDIKPANLLLTGAGVVKILDFGVAKLVDVNLTRPGETPGTMRYMAPEQAAGGDVDARADLWSLGMVLQEMLAHSRDDVPDLDELLRSLLRPDPAERCADAATVVATLTAVLHSLREAPDRAPRSRSAHALTQRVSRRVLTAGFPRLAAGLVVLLLVAAGAAAWIARGERLRSSRAAPLSSPTAVAAVPAVAVLPFDVAGDEVDFWHEGIVDLLSFNIDGLGELRKIDPHTVLAMRSRVLARDRSGIEEFLPLEVGRLASASWVITGTVVRHGDAVRISAAVYDVAASRMRGTAQVDGAADDVLQLVDALTIELIRRGLLPVSREAPPVNLGRITTTSVRAVKSYVEGERYYRQGHWRDAAAHFQQAVEHDSTFARALFRLAGSYVWLDEPALVREYLDRASRFADRLPERDALLLRGVAAGDASLLKTLTSKYPDDLDGWYHLGDELFHSGGIRLEPARAFRTALDNAMALSPQYAKVYIHLIEDAVLRLDSARARTMIGAYTRISDGECEGYRIAYDIAWGDAAARARAIASLDAVDREALRCGWVTLAVAPAALERMEVLDRQRIRPEHPPRQRVMALWRTLQARAVRGQLRAAREVLAQADSVPYVNVDAARFVIMFHVSGHPDTAGARHAAEVLSRDPLPEDHFWLGLLAVERGDWHGAEQAIRGIETQVPGMQADERTLEAVRGPTAFRLQGEYGRVLRAYLDLRRGTGTLADLERTLTRVQAQGYRGEFPGKVLRYQVARLLIDQDRPGDAQRWLETFYHYDWLHFVPAQYHLAQIHEAGGRLDEAREHYRRVVGWWSDSDPEFHAWRDAAAQALIRLGSAPVAARTGSGASVTARVTGAEPRARAQQ